MSHIDAGATVLADRTRRNAGTPASDEPVRDNANPNEPGRRDLVVVNPKQTPRKGGPPRYADALFLAHMFATKFDAPQTRQKRRADPADANASYRKGAKRPVKLGRVLSKKV
jgi:hypothetical protein